MNVQTNNQKGFTIIEVVLVLAIAGLIFLMVFIALPALQRSQRDTQRKQDLARVITQVNSYQSNNRGSVPADAALGTFQSSYLQAGGDQFKDPNGTPYTIKALASNSTVTGTAGDGNIYYTSGVKCGDDGAVVTGQGANKVVARMLLEGGGVACDGN